MTPLRRRMLEEPQRRNYSPETTHRCAVPSRPRNPDNRSSPPSIPPRQGSYRPFSTQPRPPHTLQCPKFCPCVNVTPVTLPSK